MVRNNYIPAHHNIGHIKVFGVVKRPSKVVVNGVVVEVSYEHNALFLHSLKVDITEPLVVVWS